MTDRVPVGEPWAALGFSGLFHVEATADEATRAAWAGRLPCLLPGDRWLLWSFDEAAGTALLVGNDAGAVIAVTTRRRAVPLPPETGELF